MSRRPNGLVLNGNMDMARNRVLIVLSMIFIKISYDQISKCTGLALIQIVDIHKKLLPVHYELETSNFEDLLIRLFCQLPEMPAYGDHPKKKVMK